MKTWIHTSTYAQRENNCVRWAYDFASYWLKTYELNWNRIMTDFDKEKCITIQTNQYNIFRDKAADLHHYYLCSRIYCSSELYFSISINLTHPHLCSLLSQKKGANCEILLFHHKRRQEPVLTVICIKHCRTGSKSAIFFSSLNFSKLSKNAII